MKVLGKNVQLSTWLAIVLATAACKKDSGDSDEVADLGASDEAVVVSGNQPQEGAPEVQVVTNANGESQVQLGAPPSFPPPVVNVGDDIYTNSLETITGSATGDSSFEYQWEKVDGPGNIIFGSSESSSTTVLATMEGVYTLRLTATDTRNKTGSDDLAFVYDASNPVVDAGSDKIQNGTSNQNATTTDLSPMTYLWEKVSGPGNITFGSATAEDTTITGDADGTYVIKLTATDAAGNSASDTMTYEMNSAAPTVNAGGDQTVNAQVSQDGTVTNQVNTTFQWSKQSGPGTITFGSATSEDTTISADTDGTYVIRLTGTNDGIAAAYDEVTFIWDTTNPVVSLGATVYTAVSHNLDATVTDTTTVTYAWSQQSGPGVISFGSATAEDTSISASVEGSYVVRLTATDELSQVGSADLTFVWDTTAPVVNVGADVMTKVQVSVDATASDLNPITYAWSKVSGPGTLTFGSGSAEDTTISANLDGVYVVRLTATDGAGQATSDDLSLTWDTTAPVIDQGPDQEVIVATLQDATVTDLTTTTYQWSKVSGPGDITFSDATAVDTTIEADTYGAYTLRLTATDALSNVSTGDISFKWEKFTYIWDFETTSEYTYDNAKIDLVSGVASLASAATVSPDDNQTDFDAGTYTDTEWSATDSAVVLNAAGLTAKTGTFRSQVLDAGSAVDWKELSWSEGGSKPYLTDLPDNKGSDSGFNITMDMTDNVLLMHMNDLPNSTSVTDSSGEGHVATCVTTQCPIVGKMGRIGAGAYEFDQAEKDQFSIPDAASLNVTGDASFMAWVKLEQDQVISYVMEKGFDDVNDSYGLLIYKNGGIFKPAFEFNDSTGAYQFFLATSGITLNQWHHLAVVVDDTNNKVHFYIDGAATEGAGLANTKSLNGTFTYPLLIGQQNFGTNFLTWDGHMDELAIFDRALSAAEIQEVYLRGSIRLDLQVRGCADATCSGNPAFIGPDGTSTSYFTGAIGEGNIPGITSTQYLQYEVTYATSDASFSPKLSSVSFATLDNSTPDIVGNNGRAFTALQNFEQINEIQHVGTVKYQMSNNGTNWYYHNGTSWAAATGYAQSNSAADVATNIADFTTDVGTGSIYFKAYFSTENDTGLIRLREIKVTGVDTSL